MKGIVLPMSIRLVFALLALLATVAPAALRAEERKSPSRNQKEWEGTKQTSKDRIDELIRQLGDDDYYVRRQAQEKLSRLGFEAFDALSAAATHEDLEIASRARYLLRLMRVEWTASTDPPEVKQCLRDYESLNARNRQTRMRLLAGLPDARGLDALCRLVRFEKSSELSKAAAAAWLDRAQTARPKPEAVETIREKLHECERPGAVWLIAWTGLGDDPRAAMDQWTKIVEGELETLRRTPNETSSQLVSSLIRFQAAWLKEVGEPEQSREVIRRLVELQEGDPASLIELLDWLIEQKAWKAVDDLARRFPHHFAVKSMLSYMLAQAYAEQGNKNKAEQFAARALKLHPGKQEENLLKHLRVAQFLRNRGLIEWSRREFEHVIDRGDRQNSLVVFARSMLAEMLHDQGENLAAADVLKKLVEALDDGKVNAAMLFGGDPDRLRARAHYFRACHWRSANDAEKQRAELDKALEANPTEPDVLIACHRLPDQPPEFQAKIDRLIEKATEKCRRAIAEDPDDANAYNEFAWLVGNTGGDLDEALECSKKSLELAPGSGGYYDTLAHVYFAKGDYENAVKYQSKAVELEPHSGVIRRKLELFREKLKEKH